MSVLVLSAKRMMGYLPPYWHEYEEMQQILKNQGLELDELDEDSNCILNDAFILTMGESRIAQWEDWLYLPPNGTLDDRRMAILSYFAVISKMTRESIQTLVRSLYNNARSTVVFKDSTIKIKIKPLSENESDELDFQRLLDQLEKRKPCHIALLTKRWMCTWGDVKNGFNTWQDVLNNRQTWWHLMMWIYDGADASDGRDWQETPEEPSVTTVVLGQSTLGNAVLGG